MRRIALALLLLTTILLGVLYAASLYTVSITITASPASDLAVAWTTGKPTWTPIHGINGSITAGGLMFLALPPTGTTTVTVHLRNPADLADAYSYLTMEMHLRQPGRGAYVDGIASLTQTWGSTAALDPPQRGLLHPDKGYLTFELATTDGLPGVVEAGVPLAVEDPGDLTHRLFALGIAEGSYRMRGMGGSLSPEFYVELAR